MTPQVTQIKEYIIKSNLPEYVKNEIIPLLGVIDSPGVKERVMKILEIEEKTQNVEEKMINLSDATPPQPPATANNTVPMPLVVESQQPISQAQTQVTAPVDITTVQPAAPVVNNVPTIPQANSNVDELKKLEDQLKQLQPQ